MKTQTYTTALTLAMAGSVLADGEPRSAEYLWYKQPAIVPAPPELVAPPVEAAEEPLPEPVLPQTEAEETPVLESEPVLAELVDEDAVTQVAQVMAYDGMLQMQSAYAEKVPAEDEPVMNPEDELYGQF